MTAFAPLGLGLSLGAPLVIAHRGASAYAPEHTIAAYDLALAAGADYIEQDLQMTSDGALIVLHDDTLDRTTRGKGCTGRAIDHALAHIRSCDAGSWFNEANPTRADPAFAAERIPTLDEVLAQYAGRARFYIETKNPEEAPGMERALADLLRAHGLLPDATAAPSLLEPTALPAVIVQSFSAASLHTMRALAPGVPRVQLIDSEVSADALIALLDGIAGYAQAIGPSRTSVDARVVAAAQAHGLAVHPYTVNDEPEMRRLMADGVDGMFTDDPASLVGLRAAHAR